MKKCSKCKVNKDEILFYKNKSKSDGYQDYCKECLKIKQHKYYEENKETICKRTNEYASANREKRNTYYRKRHAENPLPNKIKCKKWENKNKEYRLSYHKEYKKSHPETCIKYRMLQGAKRRAIKKEMEYNLDRPWLDKRLEGGNCCITNLKFIYEANSPYTPSIDRIDSSKGYTKDNCQIVCKMYNLAKNIWSDDDVKIMAEAIINKSA